MFLFVESSAQPPPFFFNRDRGVDKIRDESGVHWESTLCQTAAGLGCLHVALYLLFLLFPALFCAPGGWPLNIRPLTFLSLWLPAGFSQREAPASEGQRREAGTSLPTSLPARLRADGGFCLLKARDPVQHPLLWTQPFLSSCSHPCRPQGGESSLLLLTLDCYTIPYCFPDSSALIKLSSTTPSAPCTYHSLSQAVSPFPRGERTSRRMTHLPVLTPLGIGRTRSPSQHV